jgi:hypothetical protein
VNTWEKNYTLFIHSLFLVQSCSALDIKSLTPLFLSTTNSSSLSYISSLAQLICSLQFGSFALLSLGLRFYIISASFSHMYACNLQATFSPQLGFSLSVMHTTLINLSHSHMKFFNNLQFDIHKLTEAFSQDEHVRLQYLPLKEPHSHRSFAS